MARRRRTAPEPLPAVEAFRWLVCSPTDAVLVVAADAEDARALAAGRGLTGPAHLTPAATTVRRATAADLAVFQQLAARDQPETQQQALL